MRVSALIAGAAALLASSLCFAGHSTPVDAIRTHGEHERILVVAHRADWRAGPEKLSAIRSAIDNGVHIVEIDLQRYRFEVPQTTAYQNFNVDDFELTMK